MLRFSLLFNLLFAARLVAPAAVEPGDGCSDDRREIIEKKWCKKAAKKQKGVNKFFGAENNPDWPQGCYFCDNSVQDCYPGTWWNDHQTGTANGNTKRLCALPGWNGCKKGGCLEPTDGGDGGGDKTYKTLFVGDSDIEYWKTNDVDFPHSANVGVGGWTAGKVAQNIVGFLAEHQPTDWVVLVCGENDFYSGRSVKKAFKTFQAIVSKVLTTTGARVLYIGTKPEPDTQKKHDKYEEYDQKIRDYAKKLSDDRDETTLLPRLVMIDTYPHFISIGNPDSLYQKDKLHLSKIGYSYWNEWTNFVFDNADSQCQVYQDNECTQE